MLSARITGVLTAAGERTARDLTSALRHRALTAGWPTEAATRVNVHHRDGSFAASFDGAEDWEYGTIDRPPLAVVRPFNIHAGSESADLFEQHVGGLL